jgi:transcription termination/antitermination protein NusG
VSESVTPQIDVLPPGVERWVALRVRGKWEKFVAEALAQVRVPVYLPLMTRITIYRSRRSTRIVPLFSGYLFASEVDFLAANRVPSETRRRVAQVLRPRTYPELRRDLTDIAEFLVNRELVQERVYGGAGDSVRVVGGPLHGCEGIIRKLMPDKRTIVVEVAFLGTRVEVNLSEGMLVAV